MTEQDILNKIKESADLVEIPEGLKPEQIETMLKTKNTGKSAKFKWQAMHLVAAAAALVLLLGVVPLGLSIGSGGNDMAGAGSDMSAANHTADAGEGIFETAPEAPEESMAEAGAQASHAEEVAKQDAGELYTVAKSYDEVYEFMAEHAAADRMYLYYGMKEEAELETAGIMEEGAASDMAVESAAEEIVWVEDSQSSQDALSAAVNSSGNKLGYSTTNLQMAGVDESDIVKTNGSHIFIVKDDVVRIIEIDNGNMKQAGTIKPELESFSDSVLEMYVDGDKLILIVQEIEENLEAAGTVNSTAGYAPEAGDTAEICAKTAYNYEASYSTVLYTYDISNPASAKQIGKMEQDGLYETSRKIDDMIYLFTQDTVLFETETLESARDDIGKLLPLVNGEAISYDSIYLPERGYQGLVVSSVSLDNPDEVVDNTLVLNDYVQIYVSSQALYLYNSDYMTDTAQTEIAKFSLDDGRISAVAAATVPGTVRDTFAINEYDGNLRILTTYWNSNAGDDTNQLYILDNSLKRAGSIENIAEGETIYAARYFGDLAYFITYRNIDPLFAADLSDINNPKILGELKITGYSEYLHMWGEDKLLGIGYETDLDDGSLEGIKLVMFDISNPSELSIIDTVVLKDADRSAALHNYKCVLADVNANMIGFTTMDYSRDNLNYHVYSFAEGKFTEELVVTEKMNTRYEESYRGLYAGEYFYMVNPFEIRSYNHVDGYEEVSELEI